MSEEGPKDQHAAFGAICRYINFKIGAKWPNCREFPSIRLYAHVNLIFSNCKCITLFNTHRHFDTVRMFDSTEKEPKMVNQRNTANRICGTCMCFHTISANAQKGLYVLQLTLTMPKKGSTELVSCKGCKPSVKTFCRYMKSEPAVINNREKK